MLNILILSLFAISVGAVTSFIEQGKRPEFFELTDNVVSSIKVSLPEEEFAFLKSQADYNCNRAGTPTLNISQTLQQYQYVAMSFLELLKMINFNETYPGYNYSQVLPELNIGEDGYPKINTMEILQGFDFDVENYRFRDYANNPIIFQVFMSNPNFNVIKVALTLNQLQLADGVQLNPNLQAILSMAEDSETYNEFKTKNATMTVEINGKTKNYKKITFSLGGHSSLCFSKPGYNIKIRGDKELFGRTQFKLRSESADPSFLRSKLASDVYHRLGLPCVSTSYTTLYINDEYMGLFTINDAYKSSWFEYEYGIEETTSLYKCDTLAFLTLENSPYLCKNDNDDINDSTEYAQFLMTLDAAQSAADIEDIFEVDYFLTEMVLEYILGSWDRLLHIGHNYYMFKQPNGKWIYLAYDFDHEFGINMDRGIMGPITVDAPERIQKLNRDYPNYSFDDWETRHLHIIDILIRNDPSRFNTILKEVVTNTFNPDTLYPHIDELKELIRPYVQKDYASSEDGHLPGRINDIGDEFYNYRQWDANIEFTSVPTDQYFAYGIKYWILAKYRYLCQAYQIDCNAVYLDDHYDYPVDSEVEFTGYDWSKYFPDFDMTSTTSAVTTTTTTTTTTVDTTETTTPVTTTVSETTTTSTVIDHSEPTQTNELNEPEYQCWAELAGYPCCPPNVTTVYANDVYGDWSYDFENETWCGLTIYTSPSNPDAICWSKSLGYDCCKGCMIYEVDEQGSWGYENHHWCGIQSFCQ